MLVRLTAEAGSGRDPASSFPRHAMQYGLRDIGPKVPARTDLRL